MASELVRLAKVEATWYNHRIFNVRCIKNNLIPKSLVVKPPDYTLQSQKIAHAAGKAFLKQRIFLTNKQLCDIRYHSSQLSRRLHSILTPVDYSSLLSKANFVWDTQGKRVKDRHIRKFNALMYAYSKDNTVRQYEDKSLANTFGNVINLSNRPLTKVEQTLLEKGLNFAVSKQKLRAEEIIAGVEPALSKLTLNEAENVRMELVGVIKGQQAGISNLTQEERMAIKSLRDDKSVIITKADKGNATVVLNTQDYKEKMHQHLSEGPYTPVVNKTVSAVMNRNKVEVGDYLRGVKDSLGSGKWYSLYPKTKVVPRMYGLPKIHKPSTPMRPIVDGIGCPSHELARYLAKILQPLTCRTGSFVKNSIDFANKIKATNIEDDEFLVSFDIKSLFTNVPKQGALETAKELLSNDFTLNDRTKLSVEQIIQGMSVCLGMGYFIYDSQLYFQGQGLAMGSPISPVLANIYMEQFEKNVLHSFESPPRVWWRYVDDTFVVIKRNLVDTFLVHLNSGDSAIQFTMETESRLGELPFLDCLVKRVGTSLRTTLYRKPTDTEKILSFSSAHPKSVYAGIACSMFHRARNLCSNVEDQEAAQREAFAQLSKNGYPKRFIKRQLDKVLHPQPRIQRQWTATAVIPYKQGTSEAACRILNSVNIRVVYAKGQTLRSSLVHLKDPLPVDQTSNCIYKIRCAECPAEYVGQTVRELNTRIAEHKRRINKPVRNERDYQILIKDSAIAGHALDTGHKIDLTNVKIVARGFRSTQHRLAAETVEIVKSDKAVNRTDGTELSGVWRPVLVPLRRPHATAGYHNPTHGVESQ